MFPETSAPISEWLAKAVALLPHSESAKLDLEVLLCHTLDKSRTFLYTWPETQLTHDQYLTLTACVERRQQGHPVAHLVGYKEFWSLPLKVTPTTLIPRPDTETLIEWVLDHFSEDVSEGSQRTDSHNTDSHNTAVQSIGPHKKAVDLGTGTGAIALALASEYPSWEISGCDRVPEAVELARFNASTLGLEKVRFFQSNWFEQFDLANESESYHLIISNPPYIAECDKHLEEGDVVFEPKSALVAGDDGLDDIRLIVRESLVFLAEGGCLLIEHGYDQASSVAALFVEAGYLGVGSGQDYGGNDRFTFGWKNKVGSKG